MKTLLSLLICFTAFAGSDELRELQKKHRSLRHEEKRIWKQMQEDCRNKYPKMYDHRSNDYDAYFKCTEEIKDKEAIFEDQLRDEICQKIGVSCRDNKSLN